MLEIGLLSRRKPKSQKSQISLEESQNHNIYGPRLGDIPLALEQMKVLVAQPCLTLCNPMDCRATLSMGFSGQECWSGLPCPSPGDLPDPGIKPGSLALQADSSLLSHHGSPEYIYLHIWYNFRAKTNVPT